MPSSPGRANKISHAGRAYISINEAADYLGVTSRTIRQMVADGRLRAYRSGQRLVRLRIEEIDAAMKPFGGAA